MSVNKKEAAAIAGLTTLFMLTVILVVGPFLEKILIWCGL